ncbi:MAG: AsnC family transcriptional regulator [Flavobacteriales bacterium]|nr:AsnC family transcriptional regulator [Flavobacteriales bacterium]|tara:strand:+ start:5073 stop:5552 length:480 start_codon:yes stop_codon:yes gene_type:complete
MELGIKLDVIDLKILSILQEKGRITNLQLSQDIGLSPAPTLERVKKLESSGIIEGYYAQVNETLLGMGIKAFISISLERQKVDSIVTFKQKIQAIPEILECYQITGNADYFLKVIVKDIPSFEKLISNKLSQIEEIGQMQTMMILSKVKDAKVIPIDIE